MPSRPSKQHSQVSGDIQHFTDECSSGRSDVGVSTDLGFELGFELQNCMFVFQQTTGGVAFSGQLQNHRVKLSQSLRDTYPVTE